MDRLTDILDGLIQEGVPFTDVTVENGAIHITGDDDDDAEEEEEEEDDDDNNEE